MEGEYAYIGYVVIYLYVCVCVRVCLGVCVCRGKLLRLFVLSYFVCVVEGGKEDSCQQWEEDSCNIVQDLPLHKHSAGTHSAGTHSAGTHSAGFYSTNTLQDFTRCRILLHKHGAGFYTVQDFTRTISMLTRIANADMISPFMFIFANIHTSFHD